MKSLVIGAYGLGALLAVQHSPEVFAQATSSAVVAAAGQGDVLEAVIVTGTRQQGLKAVDSATPIQVIDASTLKRTGQTDVMQALAAIIPSFTAEATGFDTANLTLSARLRGLSPNDALVLVNGKRRHTTANLHVDGGSPTSGAATADLSFIPLSLVDHVEVLLDGAAAQYGTDAIAGVINIILKRNDSGGSVEIVGGAYYDEGGRTGSGAYNIGLKPIENSYVNISLEQKYHGFSNRGAIDGRFFDPANLSDPVNRRLVNYPDYPYSNRISGDAQYHTTLIGYNAGYDVSDMLQFYSFGTVGRREAKSYENYRLPSRAPAVYPLGFNPLEALGEHDFGLTFGAKGTVAGWNYDLSMTHGSDMERISTLSSINASINGAYVPAGQPNGYSQTDFYDGSFRTGQTTSNFDLTRDFEIGLAGPLTVAAGVEYRTDRYAISPGDPQSYFGSGASSFSGYSDANSGSYRRNDKSGYVDLAVTPIKGLLVDVAGRVERYSDFGSAKVGKGTVRYDFNRSFAVRGTFSNGFRAPTLAEQFYSGNNVGPDSIYLQLPPNSQAAKAFNLPDLQPETSHNVSFGVVVKPVEAMVVTLDAYQILLKNRIVASGSFDGYLGGAGGVQNHAIVNALTASGINPQIYTYPDGSAGISFFTNGADTRTSGLDLVVSYLTNIEGYGSIDWSIGGNYTDTTLRRVGQAPAILGGGAILDKTASSVLTDATPKFRVSFGGLWRYGPFAVTLRETFYGKSSFFQQGNDGVYYNNELKAKALTDLEVSYQPFKGWTIAAGAKNLFNTYPTKLNSAYLATYFNPAQGVYSNGNVTQYPQISPYGINGGYYYGRLTYAF
jgi:iron complex outermembrane receptor protein